MKAPYFEKQNKKVFLTVKDTAYDYPSHFHSFIEVVHCFKGEQTVVINGEKYRLSSGDTAFILPFNLHEYKIGSSLNTNSLSIMCETGVLGMLFPTILTSGLDTPIIKSGELFSKVYDAFLEISKSTSESEILGYLIVVLSEAVNKLSFSRSFFNNNTDIVKSLCSYIESNFSDNLTIDGLSKNFGYSKSYIAHVFSDKLKIPFRKYLNGIRCEKAYSLLKLKDKSVTEVASEVGFLSINTFTRCFKQIYNKTPIQIKNSRI